MRKIIKGEWAKPFMERKVCRTCEHIHRDAMVNYCECCKKSMERLYKTVTVKVKKKPKPVKKTPVKTKIKKSVAPPKKTTRTKVVKKRVNA